MSVRWYTVVVDCIDVGAQASWWAEVLDWKKVYEAPGRPGGQRVLRAQLARLT